MASSEQYLIKRGFSEKPFYILAKNTLFPPPQYCLDNCYEAGTVGTSQKGKILL